MLSIKNWLGNPELCKTAVFLGEQEEHIDRNNRYVVVKLYHNLSCHSVATFTY